MKVKSPKEIKCPQCGGTVAVEKAKYSKLESLCREYKIEKKYKVKRMNEGFY